MGKSAESPTDALRLRLGTGLAVRFFVLPPFDRERLRLRNARDSELDAAAAAEKTPEQRFVETLELCEVVRQLSVATGSASEAPDLEAKARLYVRPLRAAME